MPVVGTVTTVRGSTIGVERLRDGELFLLLPCDSHNPKPVELGAHAAGELGRLLLEALSAPVGEGS